MHKKLFFSREKGRKKNQIVQVQLTSIRKHSSRVDFAFGQSNGLDGARMPSRCITDDSTRIPQLSFLHNDLEEWLCALWEAEKMKKCLHMHM